jgi:hypothetical protein
MLRGAFLLLSLLFLSVLVTGKKQHHIASGGMVAFSSQMSESLSSHQHEKITDSMEDIPKRDEPLYIGVGVTMAVCTLAALIVGGLAFYGACVLKEQSTFGLPCSCATIGICLGLFFLALPITWYSLYYLGNTYDITPVKVNITFSSRIDTAFPLS